MWYNFHQIVLLTLILHTNTLAQPPVPIRTSRVKPLVCQFHIFARRPCNIPWFSLHSYSSLGILISDNLSKYSSHSFDSLAIAFIFVVLILSQISSFPLWSRIQRNPFRHSLLFSSINQIFSSMLMNCMQFTSDTSILMCVW